MPELSLEELTEIGKEIRSFLMLRTRPVAIKLIRRPEDFPEKTTFPLKDLNCKVTPCQGLHIVRTWGITLGMKREDFLGMPCGVFYGLASYEGGDETLAKHWVELGLFKDVETAMKFLDASSQIPLGEYIGIAMSPLEWTRIKPDVVVIYGNPGQISKLVIAVSCVQGVGVISTLTGLAGLCVGALIPALQTGDFKVFIPGAGERGIAMTQDDELGMVIPYKKLKEISEGLSGLKAAKAGAMRYPVAPYLHYTAEKHPYVKIEGKLKWQ